MINRFNNGLEASNFQYYIAEGPTVQQLEKYQAGCQELAVDAERFARNNGYGLVHIFNKAHEAKVAGLDFTGRPMPQNWMPGGYCAVPRELSTVGQMGNLRMHHAFMFVNGVVKQKDSDLYAAVVRKEKDQWIIACPVVDGKSVPPANGRAIDLKTYAEMTGQDPASVQSPAVDPAFEPPFRDKFPFRSSIAAAPAHG